MSLRNQKPAFRTSTLKTLLVAGAALLALSASAGASLPVSLPSASQTLDTPVGGLQADAGQQGASACLDAAAPALPALPAVPVPVAVPQTDAAADACLDAGLDGAQLGVAAGAAGTRAGTTVAAQSPVDAEQVAADAAGTAHEAKGFFESIVDALFGWL